MSKKDTGHFVERQYKWENTNLMLRHSNYNGLKTGITEAAGPCLSASYKNSKDSRQWYIIILLNSKSMVARWEEVP
jgi:D-alanyl-D-alanine carboxypeptidase